MTAFSIVGGELHAEGVPLSAIAERFGTPCYVYSRAALEGRFRAFDAAFAGIPHLVCYAVKANSNLAVLNILARLGSGFDIVSGGELARVDRRRRRSGEDRVLGRRQDRGRNGSGARGRHPLLQRRVGGRARRARRRRGARRASVAPVSLPRESRRRSEDASVHRDRLEGEQVRRRLRGGAGALPARGGACRHIDVRGIDCHIGSQITELVRVRRGGREDVRAGRSARGRRHRARARRPGRRASASATATRRRSIPYAYALADAAGAAARAGTSCCSSPAGFLVGNAGVLLTRVLYLKPGEAHELRDRRRGDERPPAARALRRVARVEPVRPRAGAPRRWQIVGPVCESARFPRARPRCSRSRRGDLLADRAPPARTGSR